MSLHYTLYGWSCLTKPYHSIHFIFCSMPPRPPESTLFPYTTLFRSRTVPAWPGLRLARRSRCAGRGAGRAPSAASAPGRRSRPRSEEHTSELLSRENLVCRLLLEKKNNKNDDSVQVDNRPHKRHDLQ